MTNNEIISKIPEITYLLCLELDSSKYFAVSSGSVVHYNDNDDIIIT